MTNRQGYRLRLVRGETVHADRTVNDLGGRTYEVLVSPDGRAYDAVYGFRLDAEVWEDDRYLGIAFRPGPGELDRVGIKYKLCGSASRARDAG